MTAEPLTHALGMMPKQATFVMDEAHREILLSGAFGAGKTYPLCLRAVRKAADPGARVGLIRKTLVSLKSTTLRTLLEPDGDRPPVLPPEAYEYRRADGVIRIHGGGEIVLAGCDNELKLGSEQFSDICIAEAVEMDETEYVMLLGRLRVTFTLPDGTKNLRSMAIATNPGAPSHFLYGRFYEREHPDRMVIETSTAENYHLPADYVASLDELTGPARERYYLGKWVAYEGAIFPMFDPKVHVLHDPGPFEYFVAGVDWGSKNPSVIRVHGCRFDRKRSHVVAEHYRSGVTSPDFTDICAETARMFNPITFVVDPSAADVRSQMTNSGLNVRAGTNDVLAGIRCLEAGLTHREVDDDRPLLTMEPTCSKGNLEYPAYRWKDGTREAPVKEFDHAIDADRYARMFISAGFGEPVGLIELDLGRRRHRGGHGESLEARRHRAECERLGVTHEPPPIDPNDPRLWPDEPRTITGGDGLVFDRGHGHGLWG